MKIRRVIMPVLAQRCCNLAGVLTQRGPCYPGTKSTIGEEQKKNEFIMKELITIQI